MSDAERVLEFWLGPASRSNDPPAQTVQERWWRKDEAFDAEIGERFGELHRRATAGELEGWSEAPRSRLALIVVLDQFSRNLHRDSPLAWAHDAYALRLTEEGLTRGHDQVLPLFGRVFFYMPLMHAEDPHAQARCVEHFTALTAQAEGAAVEHLRTNLDFARRHQEIVDRFGRFPHRNRVLGRDSTPEEEAFLLQPGSSF